MALLLAAAYGIRSYLSYSLARDQLRVPEDLQCSGDAVCITEITAERWGDFLVQALIGVPFVFIATFGSFLLGLTLVVTIRSRWCWRT
jgi:hypothetical protein